MDSQIKLIRDKFKLSTADIEKKLELPENSWTDLESGVAEVPVKLFKKFIHLGISLGWLVSGNGAMFILEEEEATHDDSIVNDSYKKIAIQKRLEEIEEEKKILLSSLENLK